MERKTTKICRACEPCRRRKIRCNGDTPCQHTNCQTNPVECRYRTKARVRKTKPKHQTLLSSCSSNPSRPLLALRGAAEGEEASASVSASTASAATDKTINHGYATVAARKAGVATSTATTEAETETEARSVATATATATAIAAATATAAARSSTRSPTKAVSKSAASITGSPCPSSPERTVYDSITATHHAPTATDSTQLFYGPSSNFAFLHQVHRGTLQLQPPLLQTQQQQKGHGQESTTDRRSDGHHNVQEGGLGLDTFMQRTLFFGTPSSVADAAELLLRNPTVAAVNAAATMPRSTAEIYLGHFKTVYLARLPFFSPAELDMMLESFYSTDGAENEYGEAHDAERDSTSSNQTSQKSIPLLPQTKAGLLAALALGALCTEETQAAEMLLMQSKWQVVLHDDAVTLQMLQLSVLLSEYQLEMGRPNSAYLHLGVACRKALALGLHRETALAAASISSFSDSQDALQRQRITIWTLYCHETWLALVLGRKPGLKVDDIACAMPRNQPVLCSLGRLSMILENAADTIYGCPSASLLQLYEKAEKVHSQLRQYAEQVGIASATTGHYRSRFDDASSILLHNWYYHAMTLAFRPFLVADSALRSSGRLSSDAEMWLRHACRSAVSAAQDSVAFTSSMYRKPDSVAPRIRYCAFYFDAACSVLLHDTLYHPSKYSYSLEYIRDALACLDMMPHDAPMTITAGSIRKILQSVEKSIAQRQTQQETQQPQQLQQLGPSARTEAVSSARTAIGDEDLPQKQHSKQQEQQTASSPFRGPRWLLEGGKEVLLFSDRPPQQQYQQLQEQQQYRQQQQIHSHNHQHSRNHVPDGVFHVETSGQPVVAEDAAFTTGGGQELSASMQPQHFPNLNLDILTTDLLNFFPVDITTRETSRLFE